MKKYSIGSRLMSLLLVVAMTLSMVPVTGVSAATIDAEGYLGSVKLLDNGESISLPIKLNNFAMDGMLFEYLSSVYNNTRDSQYFLYETGGTYQLFTLHLAGKEVGVDLKGNLADKDGEIQPDTDAMSGKVDLTHSLTSPQGTGSENYKGVTSNGNVTYSATLAPYTMTDGGGAKYLQLRQYDRDKYADSPRTWRKLTRFTASRPMSEARYAVIIYRVNGDTYYDDMLLTWDYYNELGDKSNCSQTVPVSKNVNKTKDSNWQYAIIDLAYELGDTEEARATAAANKSIQEIYLKSPLNYFRDSYANTQNFDGVTYPATYNSMDLAAVAYFPYYGDAEQFAHYGLSMGCDLKYYYRDNRGFDLINATRTSGNNTSVSSVSTWDDNHFGGEHLFTSGTKNTLTLQTSAGTGDTTINTVDELSYALFGQMAGYATLGLLESQLDENGRPVYREVVQNFVATYLRNRLTAMEEYPSDNYGWKNYSFVTGVSTTSQIDEQLFGKDTLGHSIDLATALCDRVEGAVKGGGANSGTFGTYEETRAKANELIGTWEECQGNIKTWYDAAYYLLHNLYVSDADTAYDGDSYGEYEDDYQYLVMDQVKYKDTDGNVTDAYCFDSGFCLNGNTTNSAVIYDKEGHVLRMDLAADTTGGKDPFLPSSGTGTETGETNSPYYVDDYVIQHGRGYRKRDYLYTITGNGSFQYARDLFFEFKGDDDVYLFINGQLVLDIGGTHDATLSKIKLDDYVDWAWGVKNGKTQYKGLYYGELSATDRARVDALALEEGDVYSFDFFYMERHGAGANLRIVTNIKVSGEGLNVDKSAYQNGTAIPENGIIQADQPIEYAFKITNDSAENLQNLTFQDSILGVTIDYENGLTIAEEIAPYVTNASGGTLTPANLQILLSGETSGSEITVTCQNNEELKALLKNLDSDDVLSPGDGLWRGESLQIRGIYYTLTPAQKEIGSFRNYVTATADADGIILRGADDHTVYQPGKLAYYQWVGHPIVVEREKFYNDLLGSIVAGAEDLPALGNMILIPSDASGVERQEDGLTNTRGGDVYLKVDYTTPGVCVAYVTICDETDPSYRMTVPVTIYVMEAQDSTFVLDYGLDTILSDGKKFFGHELDLAVGGNVTGTVLGVTSSATDKPPYLQYNTGSIETAVGNTVNDLAWVKGSYADGKFTNGVYQLGTPIYLEHTKPWVIEFEVGYMNYNDCLLSAAGTKMSVDNLARLYLTNTGIGLGYSDGANEMFYGVGYTKFRSQEMTTVKLFNVPAGDGSNMVYCSLNGGTAAAMNNVFIDRVDQKKTDDTWINGRDFTFAYMGCDGHGMHLKLNYLRVYEAGEQLVHYRWEASGTGYESTATTQTGFEENTATYAQNREGYDRWALSNEVVLNSDRAWEIEFGMQLPTTAGNFMLLSSTDGRVENGSAYVYVVPGKRYIAMGHDVDGTSYDNYGALLPEGFDLTVEHTYLLKNRVNANGTNMVYLYADKDESGNWIEIGPLERYSEGASVGAVSNGLSGKEFSFKYIGGYGFFGFTEQNISYIQVREDTALRTAYEWQAQTDAFASIHATSDGNRVDLTTEGTGVVTDGDGKFTVENGKLKFELSGFMDREYTVYVTYAIHDKDHTATALGDPGVDVAKEVQMYKKITVVPANVMYYEDDFEGIHYVTQNVDQENLEENLKESFGDDTADQQQSAEQDTEYGSDPFYQNDAADMSGGHVTRIEIREDTGRLAWFEFTGTGFEIISSTNATDSALLFFEVYDQDDVTISGDSLTVNDGAQAIDWIPLIPEFDHGDNGGTEVIHQVPILRWPQKEADTPDTDVAPTPGEYVVIINAYATYDYTWEEDNKQSESTDSTEQTNPNLLTTYFYLDGVRIFQPVGYDNTNYNTQENKTYFDEIRNHIIDSNLMVCEKTESGLVLKSGTVTWTENLTGEDHTGAVLEGQRVTSVNDYLLMGPNNEVYMDGSSDNGSIAFVVYADQAHQDSPLGLQIGVRAIDRGNFFGTGSTGMKAELQLGVVDAEGNNCWMPLASVTSGTEQYVTVPYTLCPVTTYDSDSNEDAAIADGTLVYHVIIRVCTGTDATAPMVSFSSLKRTEGLHLKAGISEKVTIYQNEKGEWVVPQGQTGGAAQVLTFRRAMMAQTVITENEAVPGENFVSDDVIIEAVPAIVPQYPSLSFEEEVFYNIYYTLQELDDVALEDMGLITFDWENLDGTIDDAAEVIPGAISNGTAYIVRSNGIPAKELGDTMYFKVYAKLADGSYVYSDMYHYSAKTYARQKLAGSDERVKPLVVAMLEYGAAAQEYFGYNTDTLMDADLTDEQRALVMDHYAGMTSDVVKPDSSKVGAFAANGGFASIYPSVTFGGAFAINYYFAPSNTVDGDMTLYFWDTETYNSVDELTAANASGSQTMVYGADADAYHAAYTGLAAKEISDTVYVAAEYVSDGVTYRSGVMAYSLSAYCKGFAEDATAPEQALAAATMVYGYYAENYFASAS